MKYLLFAPLLFILSGCVNCQFNSRSIITTSEQTVSGKGKAACVLAGDKTLGAEKSIPVRLQGARRIDNGKEGDK